MLSKNSTMRRTSKQDSKKRHSMMVSPSSLDMTGFSSFTAFSGLYGSKAGNRSAEDMRSGDASFVAPPETSRKSHIGKSKTSSLKRSTVLLDDSMVREYNLAIQELTKEQTDHFSPQRKTPHRSHHSTVSASSSMSSLFSRESSMSVQDLMYEKCDAELPSQTKYQGKGFFTEAEELEKWNWRDESLEHTKRTQLDFF
ncbi:LANO_0F13014g1_1 [Lachancea nothofagi CBS 11611]|uniref:LANO_0F13014g1_1 n=1 Tax=Lachancea nothofagi CBS 11611 TaxID=1266666 RepID=A0A1G4KBM5_9SACH|nr:LANO_0F13014g1_1 [Lachancea nothofagi CBS 11611]